MKNKILCFRSSEQLTRTANAKICGFEPHRETLKLFLFQLINP